MENEDFGPTTGLDTQPSTGYDQYLPQGNVDDVNTPDDGTGQGGGLEAPSGPEINPTPFDEPEDEGAVGPLPDVPVAPYTAFMAATSSQQPQQAFNKGGSTLRMNDAGEVLNHPFDREGKEFDTLDAKLTPGEFVVDSDSTYALQQVAPGFLKDLNEWEPTDGVEALTSLLKDVVISPKGEEMVMTKKMEDGKEITIKSGKDHEMRGDDDHADIIHRWGGSFWPWGESGAAPEANDSPTNIPSTEPTPTKIPAMDLTPAKRQAMNLTPAKRQAMDLTPAKIPAMDLTPSKIPAMDLTPAKRQAMELTPSTPKSTLDKDIAVGGAEADASSSARSGGSLGSVRSEFVRDYAGQHAGYQAGAKEREEAKKKAEKEKLEEDALLETTQLAVKAYNLVPDAARAIYAFFEIEEYWNSWARGKSLIPYINASGITDSKEQGVKSYYRNWGDETANYKSATARSQLISYVTKLTSKALTDLGPGVKTDFDFIVSGRTVADLTDNPTQIRDTLKLMVDKGNEWLKKKGRDEVPFEPSDKPITKPDNLNLNLSSVSSSVTGWFFSNPETIPEDKKEYTYSASDIQLGDIFVDKYDYVYEISGDAEITVVKSGSYYGDYTGKVYRGSDGTFGYVEDEHKAYVTPNYLAYPLAKVKGQFKGEAPKQ